MATYGGWTQTTTFANSKTLIEQKDLFGRAVTKTDLGGNAFTYAYDKGARLTSQAVGSETTTYGWFNTGLIASVSTGTGNNSAYGYDAAGNKASEVTNRNSSTVQNATASYDALNRRTSWTETGGTNVPAASMSWAYDLGGNIRKTTYSYYTLDGAGAAATQFSNQTYWYRYDAMDRVVVRQGRAQRQHDHPRQRPGHDLHLRRGRPADLGNGQHAADHEEKWWFNQYGQAIQLYDPNERSALRREQLPGDAPGGYTAARVEEFAYRADGQLDTVSIAGDGL